MQFLAVGLGPFEFGVCGGSGWWFSIIFFLQPKPAIRHSEGDEEGFICCFPPSSLLEGHSQEEHVVASIALINSYAMTILPTPHNILCVGAPQGIMRRQAHPRRTFASFAKISSQQNNDAQADECRITYELEEKIKLIVAIRPSMVTL